MKRIRLVAMLLLLALLFSACGDQAYDIVLYCTWDEVMKSGTAFRVNGLYGQSPEELSARERVWESAGTGFYSYLETDLYLYFREGMNVEGLNVPFVYDKESGNIALACRVSMCSHTDCIWAKAGTHVYSGGDAVIFYVRDEYTIYAGDMYGENLRTLYTNIGSDFSGFSRVGDSLYVQERWTVLVDGVPDIAWRMLRIPIHDGDPEPLEQDYYVALMTDEFDLYYNVDGYYLRNRSMGNEKRLPEDAYPRVIYGEWLYYTMMFGEWEPDKPSTLCRMSLYDTSAQETLFECSDDMTMRFSEDHIYILEKTPYSRSYAYGTYYQWKLYTVDLQGNNKKLRMTFETDGIPDEIQELRVDGNLLYLRYRTYLDFPNEFCTTGYTGEVRTMLVDLSDDRSIRFGKEKAGV